MTEAAGQCGVPVPDCTSRRLGRWLHELTARFGARAALDAAPGSAGAERLSFADLERRSAAIGAGFQRLGLRPGDSIAVWLPNRPLWMVVHFAAARAGLLTIPINTWCRESEVAHLTSLSGCRAIVIDSLFRDIDFDGILKNALGALDAQAEPRLRWIIDVAERRGDAPAQTGLQRLCLRDMESGASDRTPDVAPENRVMIAFSTSGTTSLPKLAVHREGVLLEHARAVAAAAQMTDADVVLGVLPPCGAYGYTLLLAALTVGARCLLVEQFDAQRIVELIDTQQITALAVTEPILRKLLDQAQASPATLRSLRIVFSAGATLQEVVDRAKTEFGFRVSNVYGSSEVLALAAFWDFERASNLCGTAGGRLVSDAMRVRCVDAAGHPVERGQHGELQFAGPILTCGYLANDAATRSAFSEDGWFKSKDLGSVSDAGGREFHYVSRLDDAIRLKGFLVSPGEIESMLQTHPAVAAAQVVGVPERGGEELAAAFVTLHAGARVDPEHLRDHCRARMASYKVPALLEIVERFPTTLSANGDKVMKNKLRDMARAMVMHE